MFNIKSKKTIIWAIIILIIVLVIGAGYYYYMNVKSGKNEAKKNQKEIEALAEEIKDEKDTTEETLKPVDYYDEAKIYDIMHRMANTKIIAEDNKIWGELPMKADDIKNLQAIITSVNYEDREYLLEVLNRWINEDYSMAAEEHNYFWEKLGGTIGKAIGVKEN